MFNERHLAAVGDQPCIRWGGSTGGLCGTWTPMTGVVPAFAAIRHVWGRAEATPALKYPQSACDAAAQPWVLRCG